MKKYKSHVKFNTQEQRGILFLLLIIITLQVAYFLYKVKVSTNLNVTGAFVNEEQQHQINLLKQNMLKKDTLHLFPFNPNYINDAKGYTLGLSLEELDRLHKFRKANNYVNSKAEFQKVTLVSDSLLNLIAPYFKFPDWVTSTLHNNPTRSENQRAVRYEKSVVEAKQDLNTATTADLKKIKGIGDKLSERIVKFRDRLGGFLIDEQLYDVYGLAPEVTKSALEKFTVMHQPTVLKINLNTCSSSELSKLVYLNYVLSEKIIRYRNTVGVIQSFEELKKIEGFPSEKINRISLYLSL